MLKNIASWIDIRQKKSKTSKLFCLIMHKSPTKRGLNSTQMSKLTCNVEHAGSTFSSTPFHPR